MIFGDGTGAFPATAATLATAATQGVAVGDLDRDGRPDVATADEFTDRASILLGR